MNNNRSTPYAFRSKKPLWVAWANLFARGRALHAIVFVVNLLAPWACVSSAQAVAPNEPPQAVILVVVDTLRPDRLSCYDYQKHKTKNIDRLAKAGTLFTRAQSVASWTRPSVGAMLTSLYPTQLGLIERPAPKGKRMEWRDRRVQKTFHLTPHARTLAELMRDAGYHTGAFVDQPALNSAKGYNRGFSDWFYPTSADSVDKLDPSADSPNHQKWPTLSVANTIDRALIASFDEWLSAQKADGKKCFAWIHLLTPHSPYLPADRFAPPKPKDGEPEVKPTDLYDGEVRAIDDMFGSIIGAIERHYGLKKSLIIFTSDHAEAFGEHGMTGHGHTLHSEVLHIPMIMAGPSVPRDATVNGIVRTIDILPTILDLVGRAGDIPEDIAGTSLKQMFKSNGSNLPVFSEAMLYGSSERSLIDGGFKLMYDEQGEVYSLYSVDNDPMELADLAIVRPKTVKAMRRRMESAYSALRLDFTRRHASDNGAAPITDEERRRNMEALRALGYVGD